MTPGAAPDAVRTPQDWTDYRSRIERAALGATKK
jgi:hypothetical protein